MELLKEVAKLEKAFAKDLLKAAAAVVAVGMDASLVAAVKKAAAQHAIHSKNIKACASNNVSGVHDASNLLAYTLPKPGDVGGAAAAASSSYASPIASPLASPNRLPLPGPPGGVPPPVNIPGPPPSDGAGAVKKEAFTADNGSTTAKPKKKKKAKKSSGGKQLAVPKGHTKSKSSVALSPEEEAEQKKQWAGELHSDE